MAKDLLLEIGTEEIPAGYIAACLHQLPYDFTRFLQGKKIDFSQIDTWATPRRLVLMAREVAEKEPDQVSEVVGPPKHVAYDQDGNLSPAAFGFAKKQNIKTEALILKKTERGEYLCAVSSKKGRHTDKVLQEYLPQFIKALYFPKTMRWNDTDFVFARPVRWLLCLWGEKVLRFKVGELATNNKTRGHFILTDNKEVAIKHINSYEKTLAKLSVIVDPQERKLKIQQGLQKVIKMRGKLKEDQELLDIVTNLTEFPTPILGNFDDKYLNLPKDVLITCMRHHQKYFSLVDSRGKLLPYFVGVSNGARESTQTIRAGYQRVLSARLEDAEFFYKVDTQSHLEEKVEKLKGVVFQEKLGTLYNKVERIIHLSEYICSQLPFTCYNLNDVRRTALLCKADLVTEMVKEFPELQGVMGREYAKFFNEKEEVCQGIYEHYLPNSVAGAAPATIPGSIVGIADKLDTILSDFCIGIIPTSSGDPYGLRRQAQGIVNIMLERQWNFSLLELIEKEIRILKESQIEVADTGDLINKTWKFFRERIEYIFGSDPWKLPYDTVAATLDVGFSEVSRALKRGLALNKMRKLPDFEPIAAGYKRANNILKQAQEKQLLSADLILQENKLLDETEKNLYEKFTRVKAEVEKLLPEGDFEHILQELVSLRGVIDKFFDKVMVMTDDRELRNNRLMLLKEIVGLFLRIADFSKLVVSN